MSQTINEEIESRLNDILVEKNKTILPTNLKKGVTFLGVEGAVEEKRKQEEEILESLDYEIMSDK